MRDIVLLFAGGGVRPADRGDAVHRGLEPSADPRRAKAAFAALGMEQLSTNESERLLKLANTLPDPIDKASPDGDKATSVYKNVQVLTDLSADQFNRVMLAMPHWVAPPDQGCTYCHNADNMADDGLYTKRVARVMLQMTRHINKDWQAHVGADRRHLLHLPSRPAGSRQHLVQ